MSDFETRTSQKGGKGKADRGRSAAPVPGATGPASGGATGQSWWDWGTSKVSGMTSYLTGWSTSDPAPSRVQPATARITTNPADDEPAPSSRVRAREKQPAAETETTVSSLSDPATGDGPTPRKKGGKGRRGGKGKGGSTGGGVAAVASNDAEVPGEDAEPTDGALTAALPHEPEAEASPPTPEPKTEAVVEPAAPEQPTVPKPETNGQRKARLLAEAKATVMADIDRVLADARSVLTARQERGLTAHSLQLQIKGVADLYRKATDWHEIAKRLTELKNLPVAGTSSIAAEEALAKTHYDKIEGPKVEAARQALQLAATHRVDVGAAKPDQRLAEIDGWLNRDPPGYTRARSLGRELDAALTTAGVPDAVDLAVKSPGKLADVRLAVETAKADLGRAVAPSAPPLPRSSKAQRWATRMEQALQAYEVAMAANPRDWPTISRHLNDAGTAAQRVSTEVAIAPKRAEDMVGGNDVPLETQKVATLNVDGLAGEVDAVREALRSIHGAPLGPGEQRWTGGGGKWGVDHGNYHPQYGHQYGEHSGPLPPLPGGARYREYYVRPGPGGKDVRRIVRSDVDDRIWYTADHYATFVLLDES